MHNLEFNKIFAALLVAGIVASLSGFTATKLIPRDEMPAHGAEDAGAEEGASPAAAPKLPDPVLELVAAADVEKGKKISKACASCHSFDKGGPDGIGPNLWNVMNRGKAKVSGFSYSEGLGKSGGMWAYLELNKFLWKPKSFVPDTKMNFIGIKKPEDRAAVIAWLRTLSDSPPAPPSQAEIDAEKAELAPPPAEEPVPAGETAPAEAAPETATEKTEGH